MALENSTRISPVNPMADLDERKGPHPNIQAALDATEDTREPGLTVMINDGSGVKEYWFKNGITDEDLVEKTVETILESDKKSDVTVGSITAGQTIKEGTTFDQFVEILLNKTFYPTFTEPSATASAGGAVEVGTSTKEVTVSFNRGQIKGAVVNGVWNENSEQAKRSGPATKYTINGIDNGNNNSLIVSKVTVEGNNSVPVKVDYSAGPQPKDSKGEDYGDALDAGSVTTNATWNGFYYRTAIATDGWTPTAQDIRDSTYRRTNAGVIDIPTGTDKTEYHVFVQSNKALTKAMQVGGGLDIEITNEFKLQPNFIGKDAGGNNVTYRHYKRTIDNPYEDSLTLKITVT